MKKYLLIALLTSMLTSCKKCGDCLGPCGDLLVNIHSLNNGSDRIEYRGFNAIGDNFDKPYVKYIADSILYQVVTLHDTSGYLTPELTGTGENMLKLRYDFFNKGISDKIGWYHFILHLNHMERDTIRVFYKAGDTHYNTYLSDSLAAHTNCDGTPQYPEMAITGLCLARTTNCDGIPYSIKFFK